MPANSLMMSRWSHKLSACIAIQCTCHDYSTSYMLAWLLRYPQNLTDMLYVLRSHPCTCARGECSYMCTVERTRTQPSSPKGNTSATWCAVPEPAKHCLRWSVFCRPHMCLKLDVHDTTSIPVGLPCPTYTSRLMTRSCQASQAEGSISGHINL